MIKANELRIGNLLFNNYSGVSITESIHLDRLEFKILQGSMTGLDYIHSFTPIPLTEEWLVRMGFEKRENGWSKLEVCDEFCDLYCDVFTGTNLCVGGQHVCLSYIKFVHQLQNLYFALTGEELEIKEAVK